MSTTNDAPDRASPYGIETTAPELTGCASAHCAPASGSAARVVIFPRNPERDVNGNAVLYPGFARFEGVAALYNTPHGELVVLAPTFEALNAQVRHFDIGGEVERTKCIITHGERLPNAVDEERRNG